MKKISLLLVAAATTTAAMASAPQQSASENLLRNMQQSLRTESSVATSRTMKAGVVKNGSSKVIYKGNETDSLIVRASVSPLQNFTAGLTPDLMGYRGLFGILPSKGKVTFSAEGLDVTKGVWTWDNGLKDPWHQDFTVDSLAAVVDLKGPSIIDSMVFVTPENDSIAPLAVEYFAGAGGAYWGMEDFDSHGATLYPLGNSGTREKMATYSKSSVDGVTFTPEGACTDWLDVLKNDDADVVSGVQIMGFSQIIPAQSSPYFFTKSWLWANVNINAPTEFTMKVYTVEEINGHNIISDTPIAIGHAPVAKQKGGTMLQFEIFPVDEDGDEIDGVVVVDNQELFLTFEGFNGNPAVDYIFMVYGSGTDFFRPAAGSKAVIPWYANSYINVDYKLNGQDETSIETNPYYYWNDETGSNLWVPANYWWMINAKFPYVLNLETETDEFNYEVPVEGGEIEVDVDALYYIAPLVENDMMSYEVEGDWVSVELGEPDRELGLSPIKLTCEARPDGVDVRYAEVKFTGYAQDFTIYLKQGQESGVNVIGADGGKIEHFDLQGRKLNGNPEKGVYILKEGNKASKVIF